MALHAMVHGSCCRQVEQLQKELAEARELIDMQRFTIARLTEEAQEDRWEMDRLRIEAQRCKP